MSMLPPRPSPSKRHSRASLTPPPRKSASSRRSGRFSFSRSGSAAHLGFRPPVILEWGAWMLRIGHAEQSSPQHILPWKDESPTKIRTQEDWFYLISPLLHKLWDQLMTDPMSRKVVVVHPQYMPEAWEASLLQVLWNLRVPAVTFRSILETVPYSMGWRRGMVLHVGLREAQCQIHVDGHDLHDTFQVVPCGFEMVAPTKADQQATVPTEWTDEMDHHWLDERYPNSLMMALLKCLQACPREARKDVVSNLVFVGETVLLVPDLGRRVGKRLVLLLQQSADPLENDEALESDLTIVPTQTKSLSPLASHVAVTSTAPYRPDLVSWVGASLWATAWHRHADDNDEFVPWTLPPQN